MKSLIAYVVMFFASMMMFSASAGMIQPTFDGLQPIPPANSTYEQPLFGSAIMQDDYQMVAEGEKRGQPDLGSITTGDGCAFAVPQSIDTDNCEVIFQDHQSGVTTWVCENETYIATCPPLPGDSPGNSGGSSGKSK